MQIHGAINGIDVEQFHGTLMLHRRLVREYETRPASSESRIWWAATANLVRRLIGTRTPSWRPSVSHNG